jgi:hypothetical protein
MTASERKSRHFVLGLSISALTRRDLASGIIRVRCHGCKTRTLRLLGLCLGDEVQTAGASHQPRDIARALQER